MNVKELRNELVQLFNELKEDKVDIKKAKEMTNTAGKILSSAKLELMYNQTTNQNKTIEFLEV